MAGFLSMSLVTRNVFRYYTEYGIPQCRNDCIKIGWKRDGKLRFFAFIEFWNEHGRPEDLNCLSKNLLSTSGINGILGSGKRIIAFDCYFLFFGSLNKMCRTF